MSLIYISLGKAARLLEMTETETWITARSRDIPVAIWEGTRLVKEDELLLYLGSDRHERDKAMMEMTRFSLEHERDPTDGISLHHCRSARERK